ncbi:MFS transporter [Candidatus Collierbacteria bacterium]|nr:MFS transporter [Candidatus Collierbacteria bacterium]
MQKLLQGNIWKYTLLLIANKRIFVAILGAYYLTIPDVNAAGIGIILLAGSLAGFVFEIPSGYVSDKIGHKHALVISRLFILLSTILFLVANNIIFLILAGIVLSTGIAFHSGTGSAFMHETLRGLQREKDYASVMGKISSIGFAVPIVFMVLVPFLVSVSFKLPFAIALIVDLVGLFAAIALVTPPVSQEEIKEIGVTNFRQVLREGYHLNFFTFALFSGIIGGALFSVGGFRAPYQTFLEIPVIWYGVFFGIGRAFASLMLAYSGKIRAITTIYSFYKFQLVLYAVFILILATISTWWIVVIAFIIINAFQWGLSKVDNSYMMDIISPSKFKATLLSTHAQIENVVAAVASFGVGFAIERISYQYGFLYLGIAFLGVLIPLYLYIAKQRNAGVYAKLIES